MAGTELSLAKKIEAAHYKMDSFESKISMESDKTCSTEYFGMLSNYKINYATSTSEKQGLHFDLGAARTSWTVFFCFEIMDSCIWPLTCEKKIFANFHLKKVQITCLDSNSLWTYNSFWTYKFFILNFLDQIFFWPLIFGPKIVLTQIFRLKYFLGPNFLFDPKLFLNKHFLDLWFFYLHFIRTQNLIFDQIIIGLI